MHLSISKTSTYPTNTLKIYSKVLTCKSPSRSIVKMIRFFTQMYPRVPSTDSNRMHLPECLTVVQGSFEARGAPVRSYAKKPDKHHPEKHVGRKEEKEPVTMPGFVNPVPSRSEGLLTQKIKQQIEEHKKRKEKPSLHNPEGRE